MNPKHMDPRPQVTVADLCQAIGEHRIAAQRNNDEFVVRGSDVRRLARTSASARTLPGLHNRRAAC